MLPDESSSSHIGFWMVLAACAASLALLVAILVGYKEPRL